MISRQESRATKMKDLVSKESGPPSLKKIRKRKEPEKSAFEKAREFARNVPKPK